LSLITIESTTDSAEHVSALMQPAQAAEAEATSETPSPIETDSETASDSETPDDTTQDQESEGDTPEDKPGKSKGGFQRRIDKLTRASAEQREHISRLEARLADANRQPAATNQEQAPAQNSGARPVVSEFNTYEEYVEALTDYKVTQRETARSEAEQRKAAEAELAAKQTSYQERVTAARDKYEDYDDVLDGAKNLQISRAMQEAMFESEQGADIAYHLAKNPKEATRIAQLSPLAAAREIGKLEVKLTADRQPEPAKSQTARKTSKAPEPVTPISGGKTVVEKRPDQMDYQEYKIWRLSQSQRKR
jgi:hypothetical protein